MNERLHATQDNFHFAAVAKLSLSNWKLTRYNASLAYRAKDFDVVTQQYKSNYFLILILITVLPQKVASLWN